MTEDGRVLEVTNVVWATGFKPDFGWIDLSGLDSTGRLTHDRGRVLGQSGLYVRGQTFQYSFSSDSVGGVGRDAAYLVRDLARRTGARASARRPLAAVAA
ncbi:hypothetical protein [Georgenia sp. AZ-5]|uniref:hypothetical protein n=1 Tax=Georgenia sp. AZ-5 TaxID=3367526 RepID=UPI00375424FD